MAGKKDDRQFAAMIRQDWSDDSVLRESLKASGWYHRFPAIKDQDGFVIAGNRRLKIAQEEGIIPVYDTISFDDEEDRVKYAVLSNTGVAPLTGKDRKRIAEHYYVERKWTMEQIGKALGVAKSTVSVDLGDIVRQQNNVEDRGKDTLGRKKSPGRPKASPKPAGLKKRTPNHSQETPPVIERAIAQAVLDGGKSQKEAAATFGYSKQVAQLAVTRERGRREGQATVDPNSLSASAKERLESAIKQEKERLEAEFTLRVQAEVERAIDEGGVLAAWKKETDEARQLVESRKGLMTRQVYKLILSCLHPDRVTDDDLKKKYTKAFHAFTKLEMAFCDEKEMPTTPAPFPRTYAEMKKRREEIRAKRRKQRSPSNGLQL